MLNVGLRTHPYDALTYSTWHPLCITISPTQMLGIFVKRTLAPLQCPLVLRHYHIGFDIICQRHLAHVAMWNVIALLSQVSGCHLSENGIKFFDRLICALHSFYMLIFDRKIFQVWISIQIYFYFYFSLHDANFWCIS